MSSPVAPVPCAKCTSWSPVCQLRKQYMLYIVHIVYMYSKYYMLSCVAILQPLSCLTLHLAIQVICLLGVNHEIHSSYRSYKDCCRWALPTEISS